MSTATDQSSVVKEFETLVLGHLEAAAEALFETYGEPLHLDTSGQETRRELNLSLGAAIGFTGDHVRGVLAIAVDEQLARRMNPLGAEAGDPGSSSADWIGELANQLLGRLKNKLLPHGVALALSTPVIVRGTHLRIGAVHRRASKLSFRNEDSLADVWWDAEVDSELVLGDAEEEAQSEGEMVLF